MPPNRNNTVRFTDLPATSAVGPGDLLAVVDTSIPTQVNKKINVQDFSRTLPVAQQVSLLGANSANWDNTYNVTASNSASWSTGGSYGSVYSANSAEYESTYTSLNANSANWDSTYTTVKESSAAWVGLTTYTTVQENSAGWESVESTVYANSASWSGGYSVFTTINSLSDNYWLLKAGDQVTGTLTTIKSLTTLFTNSEEFVSKRYADALALQAQVSGNFLPALYYTKTESDDKFFNQGENTLLAQNLSAFTGNNINIHSNTLILSSQNNASNSPLLRLSRFGAGLYFDGARSLIRGDHWGDGDAGFIELRNQVTIGRSLTDPGLHVNVTNPKVFILGNNTESGIGFSPTTNYVNSDTYLMREVPYTLALRTGTNQHALRIYNRFTDASNFERLSLSATRIQTEFAGTGRAYDLSITAAGSGNLVLSGANFNISTPAGTQNNVMTINSNIVEFAQGLVMSNIYGNLLGLGFRSGGSVAIYGGNSYAISYGNSVRVNSIFNQNYMGIKSTAFFGWHTSDNENNEFLDTTLFRDSAGVIGQRSTFSPNVTQAYRIYNFRTDANNYERLSLSATRIAYEFAGTGVSRDLTITTPGNLILSGAGISLNQNLPFSFSSLSANNITAVDNLYIGNNLSSIYNSSGWIYLQPSNGVSLQRFAQVRGSFNSATLLSIQAQPGHVTPGSFLECLSGDTRTLTQITSTGEVKATRFTTRTAAGAEAFSIDSSGNAAWTGVSPTIGNTDTITVDSKIRVQGGGTGGFGFLNNRTSRFAFSFGGTNSGTGTFAGWTINDLTLASNFRLGWCNRAYGEDWGDGTGAFNEISLIRDGTGVLALSGPSSQALRVYNMYTNSSNYERMILSAGRIAYEFAGTGVSRDLTISTPGNLILSGAGIFFNTPTPFSFGIAQLSAYRLQLIRDPSSGLLGFIDTPFDGTIIRLGGVWNVTTNNFAANEFGRGQINFPGVVNTPNSFALNNSIYLRDDTATTQLIAISSNRATAGFHFYGKSSVTTPAALFMDVNDNLNLRVGMGGGKAIRFLDLTDTGRYQFGIFQAFIQPIQIIASIDTSDSLRIIQRSGQTGSYIKLLNSSETTTIFEVNSANNVRVQNLLTLGGITSAHAAIKGSGTTVVAKLGDDSDYAFLQGKLQTLNTAAAGTFTPDKYLILYDSTGTAYKVPVQAL